LVIAIVTILVFIIIILLIYNVSIHKKIQTFNNISQRIVNLNVLQDFMNTIGESYSVEEKIKKINEVLIERYEIKYSTIVVYDGAEYQVKASNVDVKHWNALKKLHEVDIFKDSINTATPKYVTVNDEKERLPYQQMEFGRAKSAIFFPLYIENVYIGYWIIESGVAHDFDNVDTTIFEIVKENIITILKTVVHQRTLEAIVRKDLFSGLYTYEYLYGEGKKTIDKYATSAVCMFNIINIKEINENYSRELGNKIITKVAEYIEDNISKEYIFVRYMGPKFVIVFSGVEPENVVEFLNDMKSSIEKMKVTLERDLEIHDIEEIDSLNKKNRKKLENRQIEKSQTASPKLNFIISRYYKGTGLEQLAKSLEEYLDANQNQSEISTL
jgi:diguanylate cyclase (GGDEF)-like protein